MGEDFIVDSYVIGKQRVKCIGLRSFFARPGVVPAGPIGDRQVPPGTGTDGALAYIEFEQLACAMNEQVWLLSHTYARHRVVRLCYAVA